MMMALSSPPALRSLLQPPLLTHQPFPSISSPRPSHPRQRSPSLHRSQPGPPAHPRHAARGSGLDPPLGSQRGSTNSDAASAHQACGPGDGQCALYSAKHWGGS
ncbi:CUGBP Elav-like family member 4-like [Platysternon megacephalum]|uniref:CUGBP Elav-like family member 4-like n=1 Tax=Platysternon megacephalum TaxID=55544 RepID=A0A4D9E251_9SAUR|nr:CUGBP Elav-like family member 4-like [Platysternon megacephalum]